MLKYNEYILNEKKDIKAEKSSIEDKIMKLFKEKPEIKSETDNWPDSKCIYNISHIKKYVDSDNTKVDQIFQDLKSKNKKIKFISVKNSAYNTTYPYFYDEDYTTKEQAEKCKKEMEDFSIKKEMSKKQATKQKITRKEEEFKTDSKVKVSVKKK